MIKNSHGYRFIEVKPHKRTNIKKGRLSGGILVYYREALHKYIKKCQSNNYYLWLEIDKSIFFSLEKSIKLIIAYNPPENSPYCNKEIFEEISTNLLKYANINSPVLLIGDLNSRTGENPDYEEADKTEEDSGLFKNRTVIPTKRYNCDKNTNSMGLKLINLCKAFDLNILNGRSPGDPNGSFTFYDNNKGASTIDIGVASDPLLPLIKSFTVLQEMEYSPHCKIVLRIKNMKQIVEKPIEVEKYPWIPLEKRYIWNDRSAQLFSAELDSSNTTKLMNECSQYLDAGLIELAAKKINEIYFQTAEQTLNIKIPKEKENRHPFKHKNKPKKWYDWECRKQKEITRRLAISKHNNPLDINIRKKHKDSLKEYKKTCARKKYAFEQNQINKLDNMANDPTSFWRHWKHFGDIARQDDPLDKVNGKKWEVYFKGLYTSNTPDSFTPLDNPNINQQLNTPFTDKELLDTINKLKPKKAPGYDNILIEFLKASTDKTRKLLLRMMNEILKTTLVPKEWCIGIIMPIHKEGPKEDPDNYRGICVGSALMKTLSTMMNSRLVKHTQDNNLINKEQIGFKADNRSADHILTIKSLVNKYVSDKKGGNSTHVSLILGRPLTPYGIMDCFTNWSYWILMATSYK